MFSQPVFHMVEEAVGARWPRVKARPLPFRLGMRSAYVVGTTLVACAMPFFSGAGPGQGGSKGWVQLVARSLHAWA